MLIGAVTPNGGAELLAQEDPAAVLANGKSATYSETFARSCGSIFVRAERPPPTTDTQGPAARSTNTAAGAAAAAASSAQAARDVSSGGGRRASGTEDDDSDQYHDPDNAGFHDFSHGALAHDSEHARAQFGNNGGGHHQRPVQLNRNVQPLPERAPTQEAALGLLPSLLSSAGGGRAGHGVRPGLPAHLAPVASVNPVPVHVGAVVPGPQNTAAAGASATGAAAMAVQPAGSLLRLLLIAACPSHDLLTDNLRRLLGFSVLDAFLPNRPFWYHAVSTGTGHTPTRAG